MVSLYKPPFKNFVKKQPRPFQLVIEDEVERITNQPDFGQQKKGDLIGFFIHKFKFQNQLYLIAYQVVGNGTQFYAIGSHQNFYRDLKKYIK